MFDDLQELARLIGQAQLAQLSPQQRASGLIQLALALDEGFARQRSLYVTLVTGERTLTFGRDNWGF